MQTPISQQQQQNSLSNLSNQQLITYQQLFSVFDKQDEGAMPTQQLHLFIRGLGHCPSQEQLKNIIEQVDPNEEGVVQFNDIMEILINRKKQKHVEQELMEAFESIQNQTGGHSDGQKHYRTSVTGAKKYLSQFGEGLSEIQLEQFQQFLEENNLKQGIEFNFRDLTRILAYGYLE